MLSPPAAQSSNGRKGSVASTSSSRSGFEGGSALHTPTISAAGKIANDRDSMQTPRPQMQESYTVRPSLQTGSLHKDSIDRTSLPTETTSADYGQMQSSEIPSNVMGRTSISSAGHGGRQSMSEYGERPTTSSSVRKNRKKSVAPPEMLVIVKPPPSKQVNPMNLQIQLVIPQAPSATATSRASFDSTRDEALIPPSASSNSNGLASSNSTTNNALSAPNTPTSARPLQRTSSINSSRSARSARSDLSSGAYSATSSNSANRRVTPLYNLNFHNITATTVTDAGTDEKVAKFGKKGVDLDGFGQLEPHELLLGVNDLSTLMSRRKSAPRSIATAPTVISNYSGSDPAPEGISIPGRTQTTGLVPLDTTAEPPTSFDAMSPEAKNPSDGGLGGKFFSKFKRFSVGAGQNLGGKLSSMGAPTASSMRSGVSNQDPTPSLFAKMTSVASTKGTDAVDDRSDSFSRMDSIPGAQGLGQSLGVDVPQLIPGGGLRSDGRRTEGYFWTVRKWNRRSGMDEDEVRDIRFDEPGSNPVLNSVWKRFNMVNRMGGQEIHPHCSEVPIRFEWTRNAERRKSSVVSSGNARLNADSGVAARNRASRVSFSRASMDMKGGGEAIDSAEAFKSNLRPPKSTSNSRPSSVHSNSSSAAPYRISMEQSGSQVGSAENDEDSDPEDSEVTWSCHLVLSPTTRIPIGSLSPTPHHPKLIGQLSIPFPLPDLSQSGIGADGAGLTREELKDIISITCLFVVVREGFGGLVKKKRVQGTK